MRYAAECLLKYTTIKKVAILYKKKSVINIRLNKASFLRKLVLEIYQYADKHAAISISINENQ